MAKVSLQEKNIVFVMVTDNEIHEIRDFQEKNDYSFVFLKSKKGLRDYGIYALPTTYFITREGEVVWKETGQKDWSKGVYFNNLENLLIYYK